jgi:hypothetical protein
MLAEMKEFSLYKLETGCLSASCDERFPTALHAWNADTLDLPANGTHFGFVQRGTAVLICETGEFTLGEKMYFCVPTSFQINGGAGVIVTRLNFKGLFSIGGAIEPRGRLRYIDGCTDTLLIPPPLLGDPCLNALYFPPDITQTPHTHPSVRAGIVAKGAGECALPNETFPLNEGDAFVIAPEALHSFNTYDSEMVVIAYHPDSDFGATHENHPMINRTIVGGVSASELIEIRTQ